MENKVSEADVQDMPEEHVAFLEDMQEVTEKHNLKLVPIIQQQDPTTVQARFTIVDVSEIESNEQTNEDTDQADEESSE